MRSILSKLSRRYQALRFHHAMAAAEALYIPSFASPPIPGLTLLSMLQKKDLRQYLLAVASFCRFCMPERLVIVADPSLDEPCRATIRRCLPSVQFMEVSALRHPALPRGGCWERLHAIATLNHSAYIVQLDADTVTLGRPQEVLDCIGRQRSFMLCTMPDQKILPISEASRISSQWMTEHAHPHIQLVGEAALADIKELAGQRYMRGSAGFAGFAPGTVDPERLARLSALLSQQTGSRWLEWGSEQLMSNLVLANAAATLPLPYNRYTTPDNRCDETVFVHYIGYMRFLDAAYRQDGQRIMEEVHGRH